MLLTSFALCVCVCECLSLTFFIHLENFIVISRKHVMSASFISFFSALYVYFLRLHFILHFFMFFH